MTTLEDLTKFAQLASFPNLDEQTLGVINAELRVMIGEYRLQKDAPEQPKPDNPYDKSVFDEWTNDPMFGQLSQFKLG